jgi:uncharacterized membrane protein YqiK
MVGVGITLLITAIIVVAILYVISIWVYKRAPSNMCFIRTGFLGTKVCLGKGAIVLPVFHEVTWVSLETIKIIVARTREQAVLTVDNIRVDIGVELYAHVGHSEDMVLTASRSLGEKTFDADKVRALLEAKVVSAVRSLAATMTLKQLHENRDSFAKGIKEMVVESFSANGLMLEEVTITSLEQSAKEFFKTDNVFDAEGLKVITDITSSARREVHATEKRTTVAIRQKELDTQLELLEIERAEAFARANQDKEIANEQAQQLGQKQIFVLDQRRAVEEKEIENEKELTRTRTERDIAAVEEERRRETSEIRKALVLEQERRDREIALIAKAEQEELANIQRRLAQEKAERDREVELIGKAEEVELAEIRRALVRERAEKDRDIELIDKERERQQADIQRATAIARDEEAARDERHRAEREAGLAIRQRDKEVHLVNLEIEQAEAFADAAQEREIANERARVLAEQQRYLLERRLEVAQDEVDKALALERTQIAKEAAIAEAAKAQDAAEIQRELARESEERNREIALIAKDQERERADIRRMLARELEERDREIAMTQKQQQLEAAEVERLSTTAKRERASHDVESVRHVADAERARQIEIIAAQQAAERNRIEEETKAQITRMHMVTQSEARRASAKDDAEAIMIRAQASTDAQKLSAEGIEREAGAKGRAEMEVEALRVRNTQRALEAEAKGIEAKAEALARYNEAATFLELAKMRIDAERDIHVQQATAMGSALSGAHIRMYGGGNSGGDGTVETIRSMFTKGFALGEVLEGVAQSLPEGLRNRLSATGLSGLIGAAPSNRDLLAAMGALQALVGDNLSNRQARSIPFPEATQTLVDAADGDSQTRAVELLRGLNADGVLDEVPFETVWSLLQAMARSAGNGNA